MKRVTLIVFCFLTLGGTAQNFSVSQIPDSLIRNSDVVKRMEELKVVVKSNDKIVVKHKYAITILNSDGDDYAEYSNSYSSLERLSSIEGALYDSSGRQIKTIKKRDIADAPMEDGFSLMREDRFKRHNFYHKQYPYTVMYEDEQELKSAYFLPFWFPVEGPRYSVQQSRFVVETPVDYELRVKPINHVAAIISEVDKVRSHSWELSNKAAFVIERLQPPLKETLPIVYIGPVKFNLGDFAGDMSTWNNLGKLNVALNRGKDVLPQPVKEKVHQLADTLHNKQDKVAALYRYLQGNTRYISVQLGIGGWQPFDAEYVATNKYGDCKALSNFMVGLLKEAGIKSNYVLVTAGANKKGLSEDFPAPYFNHVIVCVPNGKDSIWLECTSQNQAPGYLGSFTGGRKALLIDEDGGHVVSTPVYGVEDNLQIRKTNASIDEKGTLLAETLTRYTGIQQETPHSLIHSATKEQRNKYLNSIFNLPTYQVEFVNYKEVSSSIPIVEEQLRISAPDYASVSGKRLFISCNIFNQSTERFSKDTDRKNAIVFPLAYRDVDTVKIAIPEGYKPESIPANVHLKTNFAEYNASFVVQSNQILFIRSESRNAVVLPANEYQQVVTYYDKVYRADKSRVVFVKKDL
ncbi:MAG: DUF3857 and transglutaminase domain-containing protein [Sediminibacterium sp.]|nr:DUF3857 and transglutaminase domain-containing protein [Sediminibacterium sp.]